MVSPVGTGTAAHGELALREVIKALISDEVNIFGKRKIERILYIDSSSV